MSWPPDLDAPGLEALSVSPRTLWLMERAPHSVLPAVVPEQGQVRVTSTGSSDEAGDRRRPWAPPGSAASSCPGRKAPPPLPSRVHDGPRTAEAGAAGSQMYEPERPASVSSPPHGQLTQRPRLSGKGQRGPARPSGLDPKSAVRGPAAVCWGLPYFGSHASLVPRFLLMTVYVSHLKGQQLFPGADGLVWSLSHTSVTFPGLAFARLLDLNAVI